MQLALVVFTTFCAWLFSPLYLQRLQELRLDDVARWGGTGQKQDDLPPSWRGLFYSSGNTQPDGTPSPLVGMDTTLCAYSAPARVLSCPVASMLWAPVPDGTSTARKLAAARFRFDFVFEDEAHDAAQLRAYVFGIEILSPLGIVWDIARLSPDGRTLRRCTWASSAAEEAGTTARSRVMRGGRRNAACYSPQRLALGGKISTNVLSEMKRAWGETAVRLG